MSKKLSAKYYQENEKTKKITRERYRKLYKEEKKGTIWS